MIVKLVSIEVHLVRAMEEDVEATEDGKGLTKVKLTFRDFVERLAFVCTSV